MRIGLDLRGIDPIKIGDATGNGCKFHGFEKANQLFWVGLDQSEILERGYQRHIAHQPHQFFRNADQIDGLRIGQRLAAFGLRNFVGFFQKLVQ